MHKLLSLNHKTVRAKCFCATLWQQKKLPILLILLLLSLAAMLSPE